MIYDDRINTTFKSWIPANGEEFDNGPCGKCHPQTCLDAYNGYTVWQCTHGSWFVDEESSQEPLTAGHCHSVCRGNCREHPLLAGEVLTMALRMRAAGPNCTTWGDMMWEDEQAARAAETPAERRARLAAEAEHERRSREGLVKFLVNRKEEKWTKGGEMKFRVPRPCKYAALFAQRICANCSANVPAGQTHCQAKQGHLVCGQELAGCWNHEQTRTCIYVHPDEPQWADACSGVLCYDRQAACFHLKGQEPPQVNRFVAAARQERGPARPQHHGHGGACGASCGARAPVAQGRQEPRGGYRGGKGGAAYGHQEDGWEVPRRR